MIRANPDGSMVRSRDVARVELGAQLYNVLGRLNGKPSAIVAIYQLLGSNALDCANGVKVAMARLQQRRPAGARLPGGALHDAVGLRGHARDLEHALAGAPPSRPRGLRVPAGLAPHPDPPARRAGFPHRYLHAVPGFRVLREHALLFAFVLAIWPSSWTTPSSSSRRSSTTSRRACRPATRRYAPWRRSRACVFGPRHSDRRHPRGRVRPDRVHPWTRGRPRLVARLHDQRSRS